MNRRPSSLLQLSILAFSAAAVLLFAVAMQFPVHAEIAIDGTGNIGLWLGLGFWTTITLLASSTSVEVADGTHLDVASGPLLAAMSLGGPLPAAVIALIGTVSRREISGAVPWYGFVANRAMIVVQITASAILVELIPGRGNPAIDFAATMVGGGLFFLVNILGCAFVASGRTGERYRVILQSALGAYGTMLALAPLAWLMAQMYHQAGWWAVLLFAVPLYTTRLAYQRFVEVRTMFTETVTSLAEAVDKRDRFTSGHSHRVQSIALDIGRAMKLDDRDLEALEWGGLLHDIGKIGVPDSVLLKQERLTREERGVMNSHPVLGAEIIAPVTRLAPELPLIRHHHEWFNGSGYPDRLAGDEIPPLARILHVADAFEAMTASRPYRMAPLTPEQALGELRKFGGIQFDPDVVDAFVRTRWAPAVADPGRPETREIPSLAQTAGAMAFEGRTEGKVTPGLA